MLAAGGPETWVNSGLSGVPKKIQKLYELNKILAHRPWTLTPQHIEKLTKTGDDTNWSLSELVFAIVLMAHFHCLSSFVLSCVLMEQVGRLKIQKKLSVSNSPSVKSRSYLFCIDLSLFELVICSAVKIVNST